MNSTESPRLYSATQVAKELGVIDRRVRQLAHELGIGRRVSHGFIFTEDEVEQMRNRKTRPGPEPKDWPGSEAVEE